MKVISTSLIILSLLYHISTAQCYVQRRSCCCEMSFCQFVCQNGWTYRRNSCTAW